MVILSTYMLFALLRIVYYISTGFLYRSKAKETKKYHPLISIIIPAWNEEVGIQKTIRSVMNNGYKYIEVIVVNDGSKDSTLKRIENLKRRYYKNGYKISIIDQKNTGKAIALNNGIQRAQGEIIVTIDADSYIAPGTLKNLVSPLSNPFYDVSIGQILIGNRQTILGVIQYFEYTFGFHSKKAQSVLGSIYIFPGALTAFRKSVIEKVGYFEHYSCTEDLDLSIKIRNNGHNVVYVENAVCVTEGPSDIKGLFNQRVRWRHGFLQCILNRKEFLFSLNKGRYLSFIELPLSLLGLIEILLYPVFFVYVLSEVINADNLLITALYYFLLPYAFFLLRDRRVPMQLSTLLGILFIPIMFNIVIIVEFIALIKSLYRICINENTTWTVWNRKGI